MWEGEEAHFFLGWLVSSLQLFPRSLSRRALPGNIVSLFLFFIFRLAGDSLDIYWGVFMYVCNLEVHTCTYIS